VSRRAVPLSPSQLRSLLAHEMPHDPHGFFSGCLPNVAI
jgi:hypothetical protein